MLSVWPSTVSLTVFTCASICPSAVCSSVTRVLSVATPLLSCSVAVSVAVTRCVILFCSTFKVAITLCRFMATSIRATNTAPLFSVTVTSTVLSGLVYVPLSSVTLSIVSSLTHIYLLAPIVTVSVTAVHPFASSEAAFISPMEISLLPFITWITAFASFILAFGTIPLLSVSKVMRAGERYAVYPSTPFLPLSPYTPMICFAVSFFVLSVYTVVS